MTPILVTGGTGTLGRAVVAALSGPEPSGAGVRVLSRRPGPGRVVGDLVTGQGLEAALDGAHTVLHLATTLRGGRDVIATRNLVAAAGDVRHLVFVSIVGIDRIPIGYYRGKLAAERLVAGVPHTILRATQFHDLVRALLGGAARLPVLPVPAIRAQPVDVRDVAARLVELAGDEPRGRAPDFGGPEIRPLRELAAEYLAATHRRRPLVPVRLPGRAFRGYRDGANLVPGNAAGTITFARFLEELRTRPPHPHG
jgi:uncharacterized protein YbjT (DUF2867 family)